MKKVLTIAGSDCSGGAGIQADLKTMTAHKVYGMSVITALTAQNTTGVYGVMEASPEFVAKQIDCVMTDIFPDAVKVGMVSSSGIIHVISEKFQEYAVKNIVVDPVMVSTSGSKLLSDDAIKALTGELLPLADVITPNIPEAEVLSGYSISHKEDMLKAAKILSQRFEVDILIKGGHLENSADDLLYQRDGGEIWLNGEQVQIHSPREALKKGICYVSEDRRGEGIIPLRGVRANICLSAMDQMCSHGYRKKDQEKRLGQEYMERFRIKAASQQQPIGNLSGGNQQKCCLAKMLACGPSLIILDEPTRGIDVGAKAEIHRLISDLVKQKIAVILISSELPEVIGASDRIIVLAEGRKTGEFTADEAGQEAIMERAMSFEV